MLIRELYHYNIFTILQEWIWPIGYFLRAKLYYAKALEPKKKGLLKSTISFIKTRLTSHYAHVMDSPWQSLPELTNSNGQVSTVWLVWYSVDIGINLNHCSLGFYLSTCVAFITMLFFNIFVGLFYWHYLRQAWKLCGYIVWYKFLSRSSCSVLLWNHLNLRGQVLVHCQYFRGLWECDMYLVFTGIWMINIHVHVNKISYYVDDRCKLVGERNHKYQWFYSIIL